MLTDPFCLGLFVPSCSFPVQAPEVMTQPSYDAKADIWSLGITCYEMAFGHPPNATVHPLKVTMLIPRLPSPEVGPNFSQDFQDFVKACCVKNPAQRPDIPSLLKMNFVAKAPQLAGKALTWD
jgi:serine/threonine-protein kinase 24/25/MST4